MLAAQQLARRWAQAVGFSSRACAELMIVASELSSNILKYGRRGSLQADPIDEPARGAGLRIVADDEGPPFKSFDTAMLDGCNDDGPIDAQLLITRRGTASGLGAVRRLTHELCWEPRGAGKVVIATRYLSPDPGPRQRP